MLTEAAARAAVAKIVDKTSAGHSFPSTVAEACARWAACAAEYFEAMAYPVIAPGGHTAATAAATQAMLATAVVLGDRTYLQARSIPVCFAAYAVALCAVATPAATPPPVPFSVDDLPVTRDGGVTAAALAGKIQAWAVGGRAGAAGAEEPWR